MKLSAQKVIKVAYERCSFTRDSNYRALTIKGRFPKVRNGRPDYGWTRRFGNETGAVSPRGFAEKLSPFCIIFRI